MAAVLIFFRADLVRILAHIDRRWGLVPGAEARQAGFEQVSLDLIYGTPGETEAQWRASLEAALAAGVDHVSAYALTVEPGTAMGAAVARGVLPAPDPDVAAARYEVAPTGRTCFDSSARKSLTCSSGLSSPNSSRKSVPPCAASSSPCRSRSAPV